MEKPPKEIRRFEQLFLGSLAVGVIASALSYERLNATLSPDIILMAYAKPAIITALLIIVTLLISRKRSVVAVFILTISLLIKIIMQIPYLYSIEITSSYLGYILIIQDIAQFIGIYFLFSSNGRAWFTR